MEHCYFSVSLVVVHRVVAIGDIGVIPSLNGYGAIRVAGHTLVSLANSRLH